MPSGSTGTSVVSSRPILPQETVGVSDSLGPAVSLVFHEEFPRILQPTKSTACCVKITIYVSPSSLNISFNFLTYFCL
jgi:hypothetical protein